MHITESHTYDGGYISLPISAPSDLPPTIVFEDETYHIKNEFHISLVCVKRLSPMVAGVKAEEAEKKIVHLFKEYAKNHPLDSYVLTHETRLVAKGARRTIVVMAHVDGLYGLFKFINEQLGTNFDVQPAHVTLYTLQPGKGIGILNSSELRATTVVDIL